MNDQIAVYLDSEDNTTSFTQSGVIKIFSKNDNDNWRVIKEFPYNIYDKVGINEIKNHLAYLNKLMSDCKILVAKKISGIAYNILSREGLSLWEFEGSPKEFLDYVYYQQHTEKYNEVSDVVYPHNKDIPGHYYMNLMEVQKSHATLSTKKVILPFIKNQEFQELELLCTHVPMWFDKELPKMNMTFNVVRISEHEYKVYINPI